MKRTLLLYTSCILFLANCGNSQQHVLPEDYLNVSSENIQWITDNVTIAEIERTQNTSILKLTGFTKDSAIQGKFLFCFVYQITQHRNFRYVFWSKPQDDTDTALLVFAESEEESIEDIIGKDLQQYTFYDHIMDLEEWEWKKLQERCGF